MSVKENTAFRAFFGRRTYFLIAVILGIPMFMITDTYLSSAGVHEDEVVAIACTIGFFLGVFLGRTIAIIWISRRFKAEFNVVGPLLFLSALCIIWLFFHADFPLRNRVALNLLLFALPFALLSMALGMTGKFMKDMAMKPFLDARADAAQSKSELRLLQSQLSPHFLFNTLNNLYGLSLTRHERIPPLLLKLSELLRYSVYEANEPFVSLQHELAYIRNYIDFEKIRMDDKLVMTEDLQENIDQAIRIAPMLLIVFVENAFKHARNTAAEKLYIDISIKTWGRFILFSVKNSYEDNIPVQGTAPRSGGLGLINARKRLELLYRGDHELTISKEDLFYTVFLKLKIK